MCVNAYRVDARSPKISTLRAVVKDLSRARICR